MAELTALENTLSAISHSESALEHVRQFAEELKTAANRLAVFNAPKALVRPPILHPEIKSLGFEREEDEFIVLQGDVVTTESAYFLGERVAGSPKYMVLNASCDLVPGRRKYASLLRINEISRYREDVQKILNLVLRFKRKDAMDLPVLQTDAEDLACNLVDFDGICQIRMNDLLLANRIASLSLVGWRIFGCLSRVVLSRANEREGKMREAIETQLQQTKLYEMEE